MKKKTQCISVNNLYSEEGLKYRVESLINKYISIQRTFIEH